MVIGGVDLSEYVLSNGIILTSNPVEQQITDIEGTTHNKVVKYKEALTAMLALVPDSKMTELVEVVKADKVSVIIFGMSHTMTTMRVSRSAIYVDDYGQVWWDEVTVSGGDV